MTDRDPLDLLSEPARTAQSSVIRDLLAHAKRPGVISLAGGSIPEQMKGRILMGDQRSEPTDHLLLSTDRTDMSARMRPTMMACALWRGAMGYCDDVSHSN